jgi:two-component system, OmpR family, sensor histidine kinase MtrB
VLRIDPVLAPIRRSAAWSVWSSVSARAGRWRWVQAWRRGPGRRLYRLGTMAREMWRRSLQLRVVSITLMLAGVLVASFGILVAGSITAGTLNAKKEQARQDVRSGSQYVVGQLGVTDERDKETLARTVPTVLAQLRDRVGSVDVDAIQIAIVALDDVADFQDRAVPDEDGTLAVVHSAALAELRDRMRQDKVMEQIVTVDPDGHGARPYLLYGTKIRIQGGSLGLYYLFPLDAEVAAADLVATTVAATGVTLVVLLAAIAGLVTRMVVRPVRMAARTAQRLSAGLLDQRMEVRGEDDLAQLAASFNQMAANLQRQIVRLEEMSRLQRRFTSDVSHELRTPLTTVRMAADLIFAIRDEFDPAVSRSAEILHAELDRFEALLTDLLEISRFDAGFAVLEVEATDLVPVVERVRERLCGLAARAGSELLVDVPGHPVIAEIDPRRVERILRNLIGNAVEHGEGRPVRVTLAADASAVAITVRDHGIGLKTGEEKLVFNRFWRADPSRARQTGGTGLGLSISVEDARLHGGWLEAWGAPGAGAQFRLTLPVRAGDRLTAAPLPLVPEEAAPPVDRPAVIELTPSEPRTAPAGSAT